MQNSVSLTLPLVHEDEKLAIYRYVMGAPFRDRTKDFVSLRDRRRDS